MKSFVWSRFRCRRRRGLLKLSVSDYQRSYTKLYEVIIRCYWNHLFLSFEKHTSDGDPLVPGCCVELLFPILKWCFSKLISVRFKLSFCFLEVYRFSSAKANITYASNQVITPYKRQAENRTYLMA